MNSAADTPLNLFAHIPTDLLQELTNCLLAASNVRIERIVSRGHASPPGFWYDQETNEWVLVVQGAAKLSFDDGAALELNAGDSVLIAAHRRHRVEWTDPAQQTIWLAVHFSG
ncbi:MAG: cupin domain-containing protein [Pirellulales bacterium]